jgi:hypothetical protein
MFLDKLFYYSNNIVGKTYIANLSLIFISKYIFDIQHFHRFQQDKNTTNKDNSICFLINLNLIDLKILKVKTYSPSQYPKKNTMNLT